VRALRRLVAAALLVLAVFTFIPPLRTLVISLLLIPHFFPGTPPRPLRALTPAPVVTTIDVPGAPGSMVADIYRPSGLGPRPAMILLLGVNPLPRNDEQVTTLAEGIARTGVVTVVAESQALLNGRIDFEEIDNLVALFQYLEKDPDVDSRRIGLSGFCIGAVLELLAAADERIADRVSYVNAFSVYASTLDVVRAITTSTQPGANGPEPWTPDQLTRTVFVRHLIGLVPSEREQRLLTRAIVERTPLSSPEIELLTPAGKALLDLLSAPDAEQVERELARLPESVLNPLNRLSPATTAQRLRAHIFLMHDVHDSYLPVAGARKLAALLPAAAQPEYTEFELFSHVVPGEVESPMRFVGELIKLLIHVNKVLQAARNGRT